MVRRTVKSSYSLSDGLKPPSELIPPPTKPRSNPAAYSMASAPTGLAVPECPVTPPEGVRHPLSVNRTVGAFALDPRLELSSPDGRVADELAGFAVGSSHSLRRSQGDRVCVFIDGSNLFYAAMQLGLEIDYAKLLSQLVQGRNLLRAYFYTGVDPHNDKQQGFLLWMRRHGYRVVAKELIQLPDGSRKANLDVEMAIDMMALSQYCSHMVLLSGDGDLTYAVNAIAYRGVQVEIVSLPSMTSESLINVADRYIDLTALKPLISKAA